MNFDFKDFFFSWFFINGVKVLLIICAVFVINRILNSFFKKLLQIKLSEDIYDFEQHKNMKTVLSIFKSVINWVVIAVAAMLILQEFNVNIGPILAAAGVLGVAVGFGSQRLIEDVISGFLILINNQIRVGDVVDLDGKSGTVEKITLNTVVLRNLSGEVYFIRNGKINIITNMTKDYSYYVADIGVSYDEDIENVIKVIQTVGSDLKTNSKFSDDILEPIEIFGLDKFNDSAIIIKARIKTKPIKQWAVGREFNLQLKKTFDKYNIEIPFPQRTVHINNIK